MNDSANDDEVMRQARAAVQVARKTIAEAERALKRFESHFQSQDIDSASLIRQMEQRYGPSVLREIEDTVAQVLQDIRRESDEAIQEARRANLAAPSRLNARQLI